MKAIKKVAAESGHFHAVRFYEDPASLARMVAGFVAEGILAANPAVIIATPGHRDAILRQLGALSIGVDKLQRRGDLVTLDAQETLDAFMVDGMPKSRLFDSAIVPVIDKVARGRQNCVVRAYGEMVDVLWKDGMETAAVRLEMLWNRLANSRRFSLLCGYSMGSFYKDASFDRICEEHSHVISADGTPAPIRTARLA